MESQAAYSDEYLSSRRTIGDPAADKLTSAAFSEHPSKLALREYLSLLKENNQFNHLPDAYAQEPLFANACRLPEWADARQMRQGAAFFARHAPLILNLLGLLSLPYDYAGANGAMVLYLSDRMRNDTAKRLQDTGQFVWDIMAPDAFMPEGRGFASILKVRLIHAAVRYYTLQSGKWNTEWGIPVNQEDMAGTNLSFSLIVIRGLRKLDVSVSYDDQQAFMHLWNVVGHLSGVEESLLPKDGRQAIELEQSIYKRQFRASEQGRGLTQSLVDYFYSINLQAPLTAKNIVQLMRYLLGDEVADLLALPEGQPPAGILNLLKISGTLQELKPQFNLAGDYRSQYIDFRRQNQKFV